MRSYRVGAVPVAAAASPRISASGAASLAAASRIATAPSATAASANVTAARRTAFAEPASCASLAARLAVAVRGRLVAGQSAGARSSGVVQPEQVAQVRPRHAARSPLAAGHPPRRSSRWPLVCVCRQDAALCESSYVVDAALGGPTVDVARCQHDAQVHARTRARACGCRAR